MIAHLATAALLVTAALACAADDLLAAPPEIPADAVDFTGQSDVVVRVTDNRFTDRIIVVSAGTQVTWINEGRDSHNVRPADEGAFASISTESLDDGGAGSVLFRAVGDFPYFCSIHGAPGRGQTGQVLVIGA